LLSSETEHAKYQERASVPLASLMRLVFKSHFCFLKTIIQTIMLNNGKKKFLQRISKHLIKQWDKDIMMIWMMEKSTIRFFSRI
jgi:hypothetical protein